MSNAWRGVPSPLPGPASGQSAKSDPEVGPLIFPSGENRYPGRILSRPFWACSKGLVLTLTLINIVLICTICQAFF